MKKLIFILSLLVLAYFGQAQGIGGGYTYIAQRYNWLAGVFNNGFGLPAGDEAGFFTGQNQRAGALYYDSTGLDSGLYYWSGLVWHKVGEGTGSQVYVNAPLTMDVDTIEIGEVSVINDGYLSAANFEKFDSLVNNWVRVGNYLYPANTTDSVIIGVPVTTLRKWNLIGDAYFQGVMYGPSNRRIFDVGQTGQNTFVGGRSGNASYSGTENVGIGELALGSLTSGLNNTAIGKGAGFTLTTGSNNTIIGRNVHASGSAVTGNNNIAIEANLPDVTGSNQINLNDYISSADGRVTIGKPPVSGGDNAVFFIDSITGYPNAHWQRTSDPSVLADGQMWHATNNRIKGRFNSTTETFAFLSDITAGSGVTTVDPIGSGNADALSITGTAIKAHSATSTSPGVVDITTQSFTGNKTFNDIVTIGDELRAQNGFRLRDPTGTGFYIRLNTEILSADHNFTFADDDAANDTIAGRAWVRSLGVGGGVPTLQQVLTSGQTATSLNMDFISGSISFTNSGYGIIFNNGGGNTTYLLAGGTNAMRFVKTGGTTYVDLNNSLLSANRVQSFPDATGTFVLNDNTATISNKRITRRITGTTSSTTPTPDSDATDLYELSAQAANMVFGAPTGTPVNGQGMIIWIKDSGGPWTIGWNAAYAAGDITLPTTTTAGKLLSLGFIYSTSAGNKWIILSKSDNY